MRIGSGRGAGVVFQALSPRNMAAAIASCLVGCAATDPLPLGRVDMYRFTGTWQEIARYPAYLDRREPRNATVDYFLWPDGSLRMIYAWDDARGEPKERLSRATIVPGSGNARLKVRGAYPGEYWIIGLDQNDYTWALVGDPSRRFLWVLARDGRLKDATYRHILQRASEQGYDVAQLVKTPRAP